jgi:hypothetical protein
MSTAVQLQDSTPAGNLLQLNYDRIVWVNDAWVAEAGIHILTPNHHIETTPGVAGVSRE